MHEGLIPMAAADDHDRQDEGLAMPASDHAAALPAPRAEVATALQRAAGALWRANELETRGRISDAVRALREAASVLAEARAREPLRGLCYRVLSLGPDDGALADELLRLLYSVDSTLHQRPTAGLEPLDMGPEHVDAADPASFVWRGRALRRTGDVEGAMRVLVKGERRGAPPVVHREHAFALAAAGDPLAALAHMEIWLRERPESLPAILWEVQLLWRCGRVQEAREALAPLQAPTRGDSFARFADGIVGDETALAWGAPGPPFWWADAAMAGRRPAAAGVARPVVILDRDDTFYRVPLRCILSDAGFDVVLAPEADALECSAPAGRPAAVLVHFEEPVTRGLAYLQTLRSEPEFLSVPVVAITTLGRRGLELQELRELGVIGILDKRMIPEDVADRMQRLIQGSVDGRRFVRVPACFPVDVEARGFTTTEYARNLSQGGLGVLSTREIEANTDVTLRFTLEGDGRHVEIRGRVVYLRREAIGENHEIGIFFYPMDEPTRAAIDREVERRIARQASGVGRG